MQPMSDIPAPMRPALALRLLAVGIALSAALFVMVSRLLPDRPAWSIGAASLVVMGLWVSGGFLVHYRRNGQFSAPTAEADERAAADRLRAK